MGFLVLVYNPLRKGGPAEECSPKLLSAGPLLPVTDWSAIEREEHRQYSEPLIELNAFHSKCCPLF